MGLTARGWCGRFIELGDLRGWPAQTTVGQLSRHGVAVLSIDREAKVPAPDDIVLTRGWLRPRLVSHRAVLLVRPTADGTWENIDHKRQKKAAAGQSGVTCRGAD